MRSIAQQSACMRKSGAISEIKKKQQDAKFRQEEEDQRRAEACRLRDEQEKRRRDELKARTEIVNAIVREEAKDEENYNKRREEACRVRDKKERKQREETKARAKTVLDLSGKEALLLQSKRLKACRLQDEQEHKRREENKTRGKIVRDIAKANAVEEENKRLEACRLRDEKEKQRRAASKAREQIVHDIVKEEAKDIEQDEKKRRTMACRLRDVQEQQRREETKVRAKVARDILRKSLLEVNSANIKPELKKESLAPGEDKQKNLKDEAVELRRRLHLPKKDANKKLAESTAFAKPPAMPQVNIEIKDTFTYTELKENISKVDTAIQETFKNYPYGLDDFRDLLEKRDEYLDTLEKTEEFKNIHTEELIDVSDPKQQQEARSRVEDDLRAILAEEEYKKQLIEEGRQNWFRAKEASQEAH